MRFIDYQSSYLETPNIGEPVTIVGYPAECVKVTERTSDFGYIQIAFPISSISDRHIVLANENGQRLFKDFDFPEKTQTNLGGLSGSPAFVIRDLQPRFVGIVKECHEGDNTILISRLGCLNPNGTIDRSRMPWS